MSIADEFDKVYDADLTPRGKKKDDKFKDLEARKNQAVKADAGTGLIGTAKQLGKAYREVVGKRPPETDEPPKKRRPSMSDKYHAQVNDMINEQDLRGMGVPKAKRKDIKPHMIPSHQAYQKPKPDVMHMSERELAKLTGEQFGGFAAEGTVPFVEKIPRALMTAGNKLQAFNENTTEEEMFERQMKAIREHRADPEDIIGNGVNILASMAAKDPYTPFEALEDWKGFAELYAVEGAVGWLAGVGKATRAAGKFTELSKASQVAITGAEKLEKLRQAGRALPIPGRLLAAGTEGGAIMSGITAVTGGNLEEITKAFPVGFAMGLPGGVVKPKGEPIGVGSRVVHSEYGEFNILGMGEKGAVFGRDVQGRPITTKLNELKLANKDTSGAFNPEEAPTTPVEKPTEGVTADKSNPFIDYTPEELKQLKARLEEHINNAGDAVDPSIKGTYELVAKELATREVPSALPVEAPKVETPVASEEAPLTPPDVKTAEPTGVSTPVEEPKPAEPAVAKEEVPAADNTVLEGDQHPLEVEPVEAPATETVPGKLHSIKTASEESGIPKTIIWKAVRAGELPGQKVGNTWRIHPDDLKAWAEKRSAPVEDAAAEVVLEGDQHPDEIAPVTKAPKESVNTGGGLTPKSAAATLARRKGMNMEADVAKALENIDTLESLGYDVKNARKALGDFQRLSDGTNNENYWNDMVYYVNRAVKTDGTVAPEARFTAEVSDSGKFIVRDNETGSTIEASSLRNAQKMAALLEKSSKKSEIDLTKGQAVAGTPGEETAPILGEVAEAAPTLGEAPTSTVEAPVEPATTSLGAVPTPATGGAKKPINNAADLKAALIESGASPETAEFCLIAVEGHRTGYMGKTPEEYYQKLWDSLEVGGEFRGELPSSYKSDTGWTVRGLFDLNSMGQAIVKLFKSSNISTFPHELGHFFLEHASPEHQAYLRNMWNMDPDAPFSRDHAETFANIVMNSVVDGGRPVPSRLRVVVESFKRWLESTWNAYKGTSLSKETPKDIADLVDRMTGRNLAKIQRGMAPELGKPENAHIKAKPVISNPLGEVKQLFGMGERDLRRMLENNSEAAILEGELHAKGWTPEDIANLREQAGVKEGPMFQAERETPEFKGWFKDSKIVDEEGKPKVVYHTTLSKNPFAEFKRGDLGIHFGDKDTINDVIELRENFLTETEEPNPAVYPVYLKMEKPLRLQDPGIWGDIDSWRYIKDELNSESAGMGDQVEALALNAQQAMDADAVISRAHTQNGGSYETSPSKWKTIQKEFESKLIDTLKKHDYDGIVYENAHEGTGPDGYSGKDSYMVFDPEQIKSATANKGTYDGSNPDIRFQAEKMDSAKVEQDIMSQISFDENESSGRPKGFGVLTYLYQDWKNNQQGIAVVERNLMKQGGIPTLPETQSPTALFGKTRGVGDIAETWLKRGIYDKSGANKVGKSFAERIAPVIEQGKVKEFVTYMRAVQGLDMMDRLGDDAVPQLNGHAPRPEYTQYVAEHFTEWQPILREVTEYSNLLLGRMEESGLVSPEAVAMLKERWPNYVPSFREIQYFSSPDARGQVKVTGLGEPIKKIQGSKGRFINPLESIVKQTIIIQRMAAKNEARAALGDLADRVGPNQWIESVHDTKAPPIEDTLAAIEEAATHTDIEMAADKMMDGVPGENTMEFRRGGNIVEYKLHPDLFDTVQNLNVTQAHWLIRKLRPWSRMLRTGATSMLDFVYYRNPARDTLTSLVYSDHGLMPWDVARGYYEALFKGKNWERMKASGAGQASWLAVDRNAVQSQLRQVLKPGFWKDAKSTLMSPLEFIREHGQWIEEGPRTAEFGKATDWGKKTDPDTMLEAVTSARDITIDFGRKGTKGRDMNDMVAFFDAALSGPDKMIRQHFKAPARTFVKGLAYITAAKVAEFMMYHKDEDYDRLPDYLKDSCFLFKVPGTSRFVPIPGPFELMLVYGAIPRRVMAQVKAQDPDAWTNFATSAEQVTLPSFIPNLVAPLLEIVANKKFNDAPVVPRSLMEFPDEMQYDQNTSLFAQALGKGIHQSPKQIDHLIQGWTGGLGRMAVQALNPVFEVTGLAKRDAPAPAKTLSEYPVLKAFETSPYVQSRYTGYFYNKLHEAKAAVQLAEGKGKRNAASDTDYANFAYLDSTAQTMSELAKGQKYVLDARDEQEMQDVLRAFDAPEYPGVSLPESKRRTILWMKKTSDELAYQAYKDVQSGAAAEFLGVPGNAPGVTLGAPGPTRGTP